MQLISKSGVEQQQQQQRQHVAKVIRQSAASCRTVPTLSSRPAHARSKTALSVSVTNLRVAVLTELSAE